MNLTSNHKNSEYATGTDHIQRVENKSQVRDIHAPNKKLHSHYELRTKYSKTKTPIIHKQIVVATRNFQRRLRNKTTKVIIYI